AAAAAHGPVAGDGGVVDGDRVQDREDAAAIAYRARVAAINPLSGEVALDLASPGDRDGRRQRADAAAGHDQPRRLGEVSGDQVQQLRHGAGDLFDPGQGVEQGGAAGSAHRGGEVGEGPLRVDELDKHRDRLAQRFSVGQDVAVDLAAVGDGNAAQGPGEVD